MILEVDDEALGEIWLALRVYQDLIGNRSDRVTRRELTPAMERAIAAVDEARELAAYWRNRPPPEHPATVASFDAAARRIEADVLALDPDRPNPLAQLLARTKERPAKPSGE